MEEVKIVSQNYSKTRLDKVCALMFDDFSRTKLKKWIIDGKILLNNEIASPKEIVFEGDEIFINPVFENVTSWKPEKIDYEISYESDDYIIVNKPHDLIVHPGSGCFKGTLANGLLFDFPELEKIPRAGIVHRLDKDTSGIMLIARTEKFRNYFVKSLQERKIKKQYKAVIVGEIERSFEINEPIGRDKNNRTKMSIRKDGKEAISFIKPIESFGNYTLINISIKTGRTHQIRVHLGSKKFPIIGDKTYNPSNNLAKDTPNKLIKNIRAFPRQALHSFNLSFQEMDSSKMVSYETEMPKDIEVLIKTIKKHF